MSTVPPTPTNGSDEAEFDALRALYPGWRINPAMFGGYRAEWKSPTGLSIRYVGAESVADLHRRFETIEQARGDNDD